MARRLIPSSFECDYGHVSHLSEGAVWQMEALSRRRNRSEAIRDSEPDAHTIEFEGGQAVAVICPRLGRCRITGSD